MRGKKSQTSKGKSTSSSFRNRGIYAEWKSMIIESRLSRAKVQAQAQEINRHIKLPETRILLKGGG